MISFSQQMARWGGIAGRPLMSFEQVMIRRPFIYDTVAQTWSRLIKPVVAGHPQGFIELNLTPLRDGAWAQEVEPMLFRMHTVAYGRDSKFAAELPADKLSELIKNVGHENAMFMVGNDIWPLLALDKLSVVASKYGAGTPLRLVRALGTEGAEA